MENVTLSELFLLNLQREGLIRTPTDKYQHGYLEGFYDEFLEKFRDRPIVFMEIGTCMVDQWNYCLNIFMRNL